jgi:hypothetical protein
MRACKGECAYLARILEGLWIALWRRLVKRVDMPLGFCPPCQNPQEQENLKLSFKIAVDSPLKSVKEWVCVVAHNL